MKNEEKEQGSFKIKKYFFIKDKKLTFICFKYSLRNIYEKPIKRLILRVENQFYENIAIM